MAADLVKLDPTGARARMLLAARCAPVAAAAFVASLLAFAVVLPLAPAYGALSDAASLVLALALAPLAAGLGELTRSGARWPGDALATLGVVAALAAAALSLAMMAGARAVAPGAGLAFAAIGAWLVAANALSLGVRALPRRTAAFGLLAGAGFVVGALFAEPQGPGQAALAVAGALAVVGFPAWALGMRRVLRAAAVAAEARAAEPGVNA
jgi:hypothetical protein